MRARFTSIVGFFVFGVGCGSFIAPVDGGGADCQTVADCVPGEICHKQFCLRSSAPRCGDGRRRDDLLPGEIGYEICDDGNESDLDACTNQCVPAVCGDGLMRIDIPAGQIGSEACDDGNRDDTDACTASCRFAACGDGILRTDIEQGDAAYESCDDGNDVATDACTDRCRPAVCGDGIVCQDLAAGDPGFEVCDDGNRDDQDACTNACTLARCGDGVARLDIRPGEPGFEECDDGDDNDLNACDNQCVGTYCGDGVVQQGEACDDGNLEEGDDCSAVCGVGAIDLVSGGKSWCVRTEDGRVYCWGENASGEVGVGGASQRDWAHLVEGLTGVVGIAGGGSRFCAWLNDGSLQCWGSRGYHRLLGRPDDLDTSTPGPIQGLENVTAADVAYYTACAVHDNGAVSCWGYNGNGELGTRDTDQRQRPELVAGITEAVGVTVSTTHSCAWTRVGEVYCWGSNSHGQTGNEDGVDSLYPRLVVSLPPVRKVVAGSRSTCALTRENTVYCWGTAGFDSVVPQRERQHATRVEGLAGIRELDQWTDTKYGPMGGFCVVRADQTVTCWPQRNGGMTSRRPPRGEQGQVVGIRQVAMGWRGRYCELGDDYRVRCHLSDREQWEMPGYGESLRHQAPVSLRPLSNLRWTQGQGRTQCAVTMDEVLSCWGTDTYGQVGNGIGGDSGLVPSVILGGVIDVQLANLYGCALGVDGHVRCWGRGALGRGDNESPGANPVAVIELDDAVQLSVGGGHSCALLADGRAKCWGSNASGESGLAIVDERQPALVMADESTPMTDLVQIEAGSGASCALKSDGSLWCWGSNGSWILGVPNHADPGAILESAVPIRLAALPPATSFDLAAYGCAVIDGGQVVCWGALSDGNHARLGGSTPLGFSPIANLSDVTQVCAAWYSACARTQSGSVECWGAFGSIGEGRPLESVPRRVPGLENVAAISCAQTGNTAGNMCAIREDGEAFCWGILTLPKEPGWQPNTFVRGINEVYPETP